MAEAAISTPKSPAIELIGPLTDGMTHSVVIVDDDRWIRGLVTQTDLLSAMSRVLARRLEGA